MDNKLTRPYLPELKVFVSCGHLWISPLGMPIIKKVFSGWQCNLPGATCSRGEGKTDREAFLSWLGQMDLFGEIHKIPAERISAALAAAPFEDDTKAISSLIQEDQKAIS